MTGGGVKNDPKKDDVICERSLTPVLGVSDPPLPNAKYNFGCFEKVFKSLLVWYFELEKIVNAERR